MTDYQNLSESELQAVIQKAEMALKNKQSNKRKEVIAKIKELAASIDLQVEFQDVSKKSSVRANTKVPIKYRHPNDREKIWTGRGMKPKWVKELLDKGHDLSEFKA